MCSNLASLKLKLEQIVSTTAPSAVTPVAAFREMLAQLSAEIAGRPLDATLDTWLNEHHGVASASYQQLKAACIQGATEGWLCKYEGGGLRYGRIFKPCNDLKSRGLGDLFAFPVLICVRRLDNNLRGRDRQSNHRIQSMGVTGGPLIRTLHRGRGKDC